MQLILYISKKSKFKKQKASFNLTIRYIDDVLSLNNRKFNNYIDIIYREELEIKDHRCSKMG